MVDYVRIDGSRGEGGGAMLRQALAFSMLTRKPFVMENIRKNRDRPGLSWQHLSALNAAHRACDARVEGNVKGSTRVVFEPGSFSNTRFTVDIGTAGSATLLLQAFLLPAVFSGREVLLKVKGGTDVKWSIPADYFAHVLLPQLRKFADCSLQVRRRGFYPKGGGFVVFRCKPKDATASAPRISLVERGDVFKVAGVSFASADLQPSEVAERQAEAARLSLSALKVPVDVMPSYGSSPSTGSGVVLWAVCGSGEGLDSQNPVLIGASSLGERQLRAESVGEEAAASLRDHLSSGAACDEHLADQLVPFMAVVGGALKASRITEHLRSNVYVAERFTGASFEVDEENCVVRCDP
ncbi:MAG: RNA 3'-terminal phosphate cyclase [Candidatus Woesearchaeota archaeon]